MIIPNAPTSDSDIPTLKSTLEIQPAIPKNFVGEKFSFQTSTNETLFLAATPDPLVTQIKNIQGTFEAEWFMFNIEEIKSITSGEYAGCFAENTADRAIPNLIGHGMTNETCIQAAAKIGYKYVGLNNYGSCYAGYSGHTKYGQQPASYCFYKCAAPTAGTVTTQGECGDEKSNAVYLINYQVTEMVNIRPNFDSLVCFIK